MDAYMVVSASAHPHPHPHPLRLEFSFDENSEGSAHKTDYAQKGFSAEAANRKRLARQKRYQVG